MAKRFGRNQKRKMLEQIEAAKTEKETYKSWYEQARITGQRNRRIVEETAQVLGRTFATLPPESVEIRELDSILNGWRVYKKPEYEAQITCEVMLDILSHSKSIDKFTGNIHHRFSMGGKQVAYGLTRDCFYNTPRDILVKNIAEECARILVDEYKRECGE